MNVGILGTGAVAQCYAHWFASQGNVVSIYHYGISSSLANREIITCKLEIDSFLLERPARVEYLDLSICYPSLSKCDILFLAGTVERTLKLADSLLWKSLVGIRFILLTSWHDSYRLLLVRMPANILPAYPLIVTEELQGNLFAVGTSCIEYDHSHLLDEEWSSIIQLLGELGLNLAPMNMSNRFRARFALTSFTYSYIKYLFSQRNKVSCSGFKVSEAIDALRGLVSTEHDLVLGLDQLPVILEKYWFERDTNGLIGLIISILMEKKQYKINYFIEHLPFADLTFIDRKPFG